MKKKTKTSKVIRSRMIFNFKKTVQFTPNSGGTIDPTTTVSMTTTGF